MYVICCIDALVERKNYKHICLISYKIYVCICYIYIYNTYISTERIILLKYIKIRLDLKIIILDQNNYGCSS